MIVEKPFTKPLDTNVIVSNLDERDCTPQYQENFNLETWVARLRVALTAARDLPLVALGPLLVVGYEEGAVVAPRLAMIEPKITHVALMTGSRFAAVRRMYEHIAYGRHLAEPLNSEKNYTDLKDVLDFPNSTDRWFEGFTYKYVANIITFSPTQDLLQSQALAYITIDEFSKYYTNADAEEAIHALKDHGRDVTERRLTSTNTDPYLSQDKIPATEQTMDAYMKHLNGEYARIFQWFENRSD